MGELMAGRPKSKFGSDGYRELSIKENRARNKSTSKYHDKKRKQDAREVFELREKDARNKKRSARAAKLLAPRGSGKRNIGRFR